MALACKLNDAQGGYRGPAGSAMVFMTFGEPTLTGSPTDNSYASPDRLADEDGFKLSPDIPADVRSTMMRFITALYEWEVAAFESDNESGDMDAAQTSHDTLVRQWCVPDLKPQPISYGNNWAHDPKTESLVSAALAGDICHVRTKHTQPSEVVCDYEYHLRRLGDAWKVEQLYYVSDDGKYECL